MNDFGIDEEALPCGCDFRDWMADQQGRREFSDWSAMKFKKFGEQIGRIEVAGESSGLWKVSCCTALKHPLPAVLP